ncbi:hypothetical protein K488DRAFT_77805 [Vararia minispora EC-137]|uniref:Uncharacterized protein n=1 Tax=Vararia minispora EC-137 TaxID=1314806 RepID=A0ACB8QPM5_9AGAM|nr:hypothetical protein K488DRAFT_77805 [Vararia minispora EC-137]
MTAAGSTVHAHKDVVAIFYASFHPTLGNVIDWYAKSMEGSALPSGLHTVDEDVIYFTHRGYPVVCVFRRRKTSAEGQRGFRLASLGLLLSPTTRPRPWRHVTALKALADEIHANAGDEDMDSLEDSLWEPARSFFKLREALDNASGWKGWEDELHDDTSTELSSDADPALHLAYLLRLLGPSSLTLYKHVLGRRRVLIYTLPPVERASLLCQAAADMCFAAQAAPDAAQPSLKAKHREGVTVLGMVTLHDLDKLQRASDEERGWIACTTDALFLERPQYYDLVIDLTTANYLKGIRPTLYISHPVPNTVPRGPSHRLSSFRFTWSDVKLWCELDRVLQLDADAEHSFHTCSPSSWSCPPPTMLQNKWSDTWRVYEDVCLMCASFWMGIRPRDWTSSSGGAVRLEGAEDFELDTAPRPRRPRNTTPRPSGMVVQRLSSSKSASPTLEEQVISERAAEPAVYTDASTTAAEGRSSEDVADWVALARRRVLTARSLLQAFDANTTFLLSRLALALPPIEERPARVALSPQMLAGFELGPLSALDARFIDWLAADYGDGCSIVVRRGWRDILGFVFGLGG